MQHGRGLAIALFVIQPKLVGRWLAMQVVRNAFECKTLELPNGIGFNGH